MERIYGINVLSLWPWSVGRHGGFGAITMALDAGFDGIQALPLRGCSYEMFKEFVISYEDSFANGGFLESSFNSLRKLLRIEGTQVLSPLLEDWLFFGRDNKILPAIPGALKVIHFAEDSGDTLEINPGAGIFSEPYKRFVERRGNHSLCLDTMHARGENRRAGQAVMEPWSVLLKCLPKDSIGLIHVHPVQNSRIDELELLLRGERCEFLEMLEKLRGITNAPAILEIIPPIIKNPLGLWTKKKTVDYLSLVRVAIGKVLG